MNVFEEKFTDIVMKFKGEAWDECCVVWSYEFSWTMTLGADKLHKLVWEGWVRHHHPFHQEHDSANADKVNFNIVKKAEIGKVNLGKVCSDHYAIGAGEKNHKDCTTKRSNMQVSGTVGGRFGDDVGKTFIRTVDGNLIVLHTEDENCGACGEPHIKKWDGVYYDYHGTPTVVISLFDFVRMLRGPYFFCR